MAKGSFQLFRDVTTFRFSYHVSFEIKIVSGIMCGVVSGLSGGATEPSQPDLPLWTRFGPELLKSAGKVLRKVPVRNGVPRKVPKKVLQAPRLCRGSIGVGTRSTFFGTFLGTPLRTGTFRSTFSGTFPGRGFGTSLDGRQDCKTRVKPEIRFFGYESGPNQVRRGGVRRGSGPDE